MMARAQKDWYAVSVFALTAVVLAFVLLVLLATFARGQEPDNPVAVIAFHSQNCQYCPAMRPIWKTLSESHQLMSIDINQQPSVAARYSVTAVPTTIVVSKKGGKLTQYARLSGRVTLEKVEEFISAAKKEK